MEYDERPWGNYQVLDEGPGFKVKRITVHPGKRLSLQRHARREEHWVIVAGTGLATRDDERVELGPRDAFDIPLGAVHRLENPGTEPLVMIEVQHGDYLGEDDIVRIEDDFGRLGAK
jgi:mannose-6-phosphate isomerase